MARSSNLSSCGHRSSDRRFDRGFASGDVPRNARVEHSSRKIVTISTCLPLCLVTGPCRYTRWVHRSAQFPESLTKGWCWSDFGGGAAQPSRLICPRRRNGYASAHWAGGGRSTTTASPTRQSFSHSSRFQRRPNNGGKTRDGIIPAKCSSSKLLRGESTVKQIALPIG